jgi:hypothetical protein
MQATLDDVAGRLYQMSEGLHVSGLAIEHCEGMQRIIDQLQPGEDIPRPEGEFRIIIDVVPAIVRREGAVPQEHGRAVR